MQEQLPKDAKTQEKYNMPLNNYDFIFASLRLCASQSFWAGL